MRHPTKDEAAALLAAVDAARAKREALMPDEQAAIGLFFDAWQRLKDFGWREAIYCPKDGSEFLAIEPGSTGQHLCAYVGEWPDGSWWLHCPDGDACPSHPCLWKPIDAPTACGHSKDYETCSHGRRCLQQGDAPCPLPSWRAYE